MSDFGGGGDPNSFSIGLNAGTNFARTIAQAQYQKDLVRQQDEKFRLELTQAGYDVGKDGNYKIVDGGKAHLAQTQTQNLIRSQQLVSGQIRETQSKIDNINIAQNRTMLGEVLKNVSQSGNWKYLNTYLNEDKSIKKSLQDFGWSNVREVDFDKDAVAVKRSLGENYDSVKSRDELRKRFTSNNAIYTDENGRDNVISFKTVLGAVGASNTQQGVHLDLVNDELRESIGQASKEDAKKPANLDMLNKMLETAKKDGNNSVVSFITGEINKLNPQGTEQQTTPQGIEQSQGTQGTEQPKNYDDILGPEFYKTYEPPQALKGTEYEKMYNDAMDKASELVGFDTPAGTDLRTFMRMISDPSATMAEIAPKLHLAVKLASHIHDSMGPGLDKNTMDYKNEAEERVSRDRANNVRLALEMEQQEADKIKAQKKALSEGDIEAFRAKWGEIADAEVELARCQYGKENYAQGYNDVYNKGSSRCASLIQNYNQAFGDNYRKKWDEIYTMDHFNLGNVSDNFKNFMLKDPDKMSDAEMKESIEEMLKTKRIVGMLEDSKVQNPDTISRKEYRAIHLLANMQIKLQSGQAVSESEMNRFFKAFGDVENATLRSSLLGGVSEILTLNKTYDSMISGTNAVDDPLLRNHINKLSHNIYSIGKRAAVTILNQVKEVETGSGKKLVRSGVQEKNLGPDEKAFLREARGYLEQNRDRAYTYVRRRCEFKSYYEGGNMEQCNELEQQKEKDMQLMRDMALEQPLDSSNKSYTTKPSSTSSSTQSNDYYTKETL